MTALFVFMLIPISPAGNGREACIRGARRLVIGERILDTPACRRAATTHCKPPPPSPRQDSTATPRWSSRRAAVQHASHVVGCESAAHHACRPRTTLKVLDLNVPDTCLNLSSSAARRVCHSAVPPPPSAPTSHGHRPARVVALLCSSLFKQPNRLGFVNA